MIEGEMTALVDPVMLLSLYSEPIRSKKLSLVVRANNGSGKSQYLIAPCSTWLSMRFKLARSVITSSSGTQLDRQTGSAITHICQQVNKFWKQDLWKINYRFYTYLPTGSTIELYATDDPGLAEGYHPHLGGEEFAMFCDEGKNIPKGIYDAIERCNGMTRRLDVSSPGAPSGHFYEVCLDDGWWQRKVTYHDCPHIKEDEVREALKRSGGENSPWFKSAYLAEFSSTDESVVIAHHRVYNHFKNLPPYKEFGEPFAGVDYSASAGGDENVISVFLGNKQIGMEVFRFDDTTKSVEHIHKLLTLKYKVKAENVNVDDGGVGKAMTDQLWKLGYNVNRTLNQSKAIRTDMYANRGAELWFHFASIMDDIILLDSDTLRSQLSNRFYRQQAATGKLLLESKKEAKAKGHPSPDRADSVILAFARKPNPYLATLLEDPNNVVKEKRAALPTNDELIEIMNQRRFGQLNNSEPSLSYGSLNATLSEQLQYSYDHSSK
jgi:hypothetical protein